MDPDYPIGLQKPAYDRNEPQLNFRDRINISGCIGYPENKVSVTKVI
jgi:hypothetical protein